MKRLLIAVLLGTFCLMSAGIKASYAGEIDLLLQKLVEKGVLTGAEAFAVNLPMLAISSECGAIKTPEITILSASSTLIVVRVIMSSVTIPEKPDQGMGVDGRYTAKSLRPSEAVNSLVIKATCVIRLEGNSTSTTSRKEALLMPLLPDLPDTLSITCWAPV